MSEVPHEARDVMARKMWAHCRGPQYERTTQGCLSVVALMDAREPRMEASDQRHVKPCLGYHICFLASFGVATKMVLPMHQCSTKCSCT
jgi:hypothetical protein